MNQPTGLQAQLDQRMVMERAQLYAAGYPNTLASEGNAAVVRVELPPANGVTYTLVWRCTPVYPSGPPQLIVYESGFDSYGELRDGQLMVIVPQLNRWSEEQRLVELTAAVQQRLAAGEFIRPSAVEQPNEAGPFGVLSSAAAIPPPLPPPVDKQLRQGIAHAQPRPSTGLSASTIGVAGGLLVIVLLIVVGVGWLIARGGQQAAIVNQPIVDPNSGAATIIAVNRPIVDPNSGAAAIFAQRTQIAAQVKPTAAKPNTPPTRGTVQAGATAQAAATTVAMQNQGVSAALQATTAWAYSDADATAQAAAATVAMQNHGVSAALQATTAWAYSDADATMTAEVLPPRLKYAVNVAEITAEEMAAANGGTVPVGINTLLVGPGDVGLKIGGTQIPVRTGFTLIGAPGTFIVEYVGGRTGIDTVGSSAINPIPGKFYKVTVAKVE